MANVLATGYADDCLGYGSGCPCFRCHERFHREWVKRSKETTMSASGWVHLDVKWIEAETDKAFLLVLESGRRAWVPKAVVSRAKDYRRGDVDATVSVWESFAQREKLA